MLVGTSGVCELRAHDHVAGSTGLVMPVGSGGAQRSECHRKLAALGERVPSVTELVGPPLEGFIAGALADPPRGHDEGSWVLGQRQVSKGSERGSA
jgi:hypothetical protein